VPRRPPAPSAIEGSCAAVLFANAPNRTCARPLGQSQFNTSPAHGSNSARRALLPFLLRRPTVQQTRRPTVPARQCHGHPATSRKSHARGANTLDASNRWSPGRHTVRACAETPRPANTRAHRATVSSRGRQPSEWMPFHREPRRGDSVVGRKLLAPRWGLEDSMASRAGGSRRRLLTSGPPGLGFSCPHSA